MRFPADLARNVNCRLVWLQVSLQSVMLDSEDVCAGVGNQFEQLYEAARLIK